MQIVNNLLEFREVPENNEKRESEGGNVGQSGGDDRLAPIKSANATMCFPDRWTFLIVLDADLEGG